MKAHLNQHLILGFLAASALAGCSVGPDYIRPSVDTPAAFKETPVSQTVSVISGTGVVSSAAPFRVAQPADREQKGNWWEVFNDPQLNALVSQVSINNQNVKVAEAQYRQARALVQEARAAYFPTLGLNANGSRSRNGSVNANGTTTGNSGPRNNFNVGLDASWELDVWGRVRRQVESNSASAQAGAADLAAVTLSAQAELATDYFQLRIADDQKRLLDATVKAYEKSLQITQNQYNAGIVGKADVAQAQAQLDSTKSQAAGVGLQRAQLEHAIAVLVGKAPAEVTITPTTTSLTIPAIPVAVPSALLERRPDIAAAERRAAAANAEIGVARAAYYPDITLGLSGGFESSVLSKLLTWPTRFWSVGPSLAANLFNGGATLAQTKQAEAVYDTSVAQYRQTVLTGFQEVEDNLAGVRILGEQAGTQAQAVESANELLRIALNQYKAGTVSYLNVATAQSSAYSARNTALNIESQRLASAVGLIKALGGNWEAPTK